MFWGAHPRRPDRGGTPAGSAARRLYALKFAGAVEGMLEKSGMVDVEIVREDKCFVMLAGRKPTE